MLEIDFLFVYGRLREYYLIEEDNSDVESFITLPARTTGRLYNYDDEAVLIEDKNSYVCGNLIAASDMNTLLRHTDSFMEFNEEDYENSKFIRGIKEIEIETLGEKIKAWCYVYPTTRKGELEENGEYISGGDWIEYRKLKKESNDKK